MIKKIWNDPVGSKIIAVLLLASISYFNWKWIVDLLQTEIYFEFWKIIIASGLLIILGLSLKKKKLYKSQNETQDTENIWIYHKAIITWEIRHNTLENKSYIDNLGMICPNENCKHELEVEEQNYNNIYLKCMRCDFKTNILISHYRNSSFYKGDEINTFIHFIKSEIIAEYRKPKDKQFLDC